MYETVDWEEQKYQSVFDDELRLLYRRRSFDKNCSLDDIQGMLDALYILDGNNAEGRSNVQQISLSATIAAYELFIDTWKEEIRKEKGSR